ncbi:MAG: hypothetical protein OXF46_11255, partial [Rhodobacteraceae bacterium]|nr:hypothetical protein [Paracoccaceae bacterium]
FGEFMVIRQIRQRFPPPNAGTGGIGSGLAYTILEAGYRLNIPRMFAALLLIAGTGVFIFAILSFLSHLLLHKWHESALQKEN